MNTPDPSDPAAQGRGSSSPGQSQSQSQSGSTTTPTPPDQQRQALLDAERAAHSQHPRNFKEDALEEKVVHVEHGGTGPTPTGSFDPEADQAAGSGNADVPPSDR